MEGQVWSFFSNGAVWLADGLLRADFKNHASVWEPTDSGRMWKLYSAFVDREVRGWVKKKKKKRDRELERVGNRKRYNQLEAA